MKVQALKCLGCGDTVFSRARHDFRFCSCKALAVDGGLDYMKVCFTPEIKHEYVDLDINETKEDLYIDWNSGLDMYGIIKGEKNVGTKNSRRTKSKIQSSKRKT